MFAVKHLYETYGAELRMELLSGEEGLCKEITVPEADRPGLGLAGYLKGCPKKRILVFGRVEIEYLKSLDNKIKEMRLSDILSHKIPAVFIARGYSASRELVKICEKQQIPLFQSSLTTMKLLGQLTVILSEEFAEKTSCHATLVEAFGLGVLIQGDSSIGKSETALGMIERGHRLISDDVVIVRKKEGQKLVGFGPDLTRHMLEIRGIGMINVAHLYGAVCISERVDINLIVKLEDWSNTQFYDRVGLEEKYVDLLGVNVPFYLLPVKPGRDVVLLLETIVLNHRLKNMGYHSAKEFNLKLLEAIAKRQKQFKTKVG